MNIAVTGATGAMGTSVIETATRRQDLTVAFGIGRNIDGRIDGVRIYSPNELPALLDEQRPNVLIDFTVPTASVEFVDAAATAAVPVVVGTTGFNEDHLESLHAASDTVPVLKAANFARGVQALLHAVDAAAETMPGYDIEILDTHHNRKRDAPSGTANTILDRLDAGETDRVHGRSGEQPRTPGEIGVHARRAGDIRGEHEVLFADNDEVLTITHRAESRGVFAAGALDAAVWLAGQPPGWYGFDDVLEA